MVNNTENRYSFGDERGTRSRRTQNKAKGVLIMVGCIVMMVLVMYLTARLCAWIDEKMEKDAMDAAIALGIKDANGNDLDINGNIVDKDGNILNPDELADSMLKEGTTVYTEEELNTRLSAARNEAAKQATDELLTALKNGVLEGDSILQAVRAIYPDELIVSSGGRYHFIPINRDLKLNSYKQENLNILESGEYQYVENGQIVSYKGIDVSKFQGNIDWEKVAADGVKFTFIRVGFRGYGTAGKLVEDENFEQNVKGALAAGIKVGVYFYSQATTKEEAVEEANLVLKKIAPYKIECPVVFDVELVDGADGRMDMISAEQRTKVAAKFCDTIAAAGYKPMLYYNTEMGAVHLNVAELEQYDKWFASYSDQMYYPYDYKIWQYSCTGRVNGIKGAVDLNISFEPIWE